jgi:FixJ family two-component response regulator
MTQSLYREVLSDHPQSAELPTADPVVPSGVPRFMTRVDAGFAVHHGIRSSATSEGAPIIFVVDDEVSVRKSLTLLIRNAGWQSEVFKSGQEFLCRRRLLVPTCLVLDVAPPGLNGFDLQQRLAADWKHMPIIFVTDHGDVAMTVRAMKAGAFDFLAKPFSDDALLHAVREAIELSRILLDHEVQIRACRDCYASLSRREREVMALVVSGLMNKQVGFELGISEITVKAHRGHAMRKMKAGSLADLVKMAMKLGISAAA